MRIASLGDAGGFDTILKSTPIVRLDSRLHNPEIAKRAPRRTMPRVLCQVQAITSSQDLPEPSLSLF